MHDEKGRAVLDGIRPKLTLGDFEEDIDVVDIVKSKVKFIKEVNEYYIYSISGNLCLNIATHYSTGLGGAESIKDTLDRLTKDLRCCLCCLLDGLHCSLVDEKDEEVCTNCLGQNVKCISTRIIFVFSDMDPSQRVAHIDLNDDAPLLPSITVTFYGFSGLHLGKAFVAYFRNWYLTDGYHMFCLSMLCAVLTSSDRTSDIGRDFLHVKDRHSDKLSKKSVSPPVQKKLEDIPAITTTVVPDPYRPYCKESQSHIKLKAVCPTYVALNRTGEPIWTDVSASVVFFGNLHNPCKILPIGKPGKAGTASKKEVKAEDARFNHPSGITVIESAGKEYAIVADAGNQALRMIKTVSSQRGTKTVLTLKTNIDKARLRPSAVTKRRECEIFVSTYKGRNIFLLDISPTTGTAKAILEISGFGIAKPSGLCFLENTNELLIANGEDLILHRSTLLGYDQDDSTKILLPNVTSYIDVAVSITGKIAISDRKKGRVHIYKKDDSDFELHDTIGCDSPKMMEGRLSETTLEDPIGLEFRGEALYICCCRGGLKLHTYTDFALEYCQQVEKIYNAIGYADDVDKEEDERQMRLPFTQKLAQIKEVITFMETITDNLRKLTKRKYVATQHGGVYPPTLQCLSTTWQSISNACDVLRRQGCDIDDLNFYSFSNEGPVEHGFG